jgi:hypothetical protein
VENDIEIRRKKMGKAERSKIYQEAKQEFAFLKKIYKGGLLNKKQAEVLVELPFVIVWKNGKSGVKQEQNWFTAYLVKADYNKSFNREPDREEIEDEFDFYY